MKYKLSGDNVLEGSLFVLKWNPSSKRILTSAGMVKIDVRPQGANHRFTGKNASDENVLFELRGSKVVDLAGKELVSVAEVKKMFPHPDDRAAVGFWLYLMT